MGLNSLLLLGSSLLLMLFTGFAVMQKSIQLANAVKKKDTVLKRTIVTILIGFFAFSVLGIFVMFGLTSWSEQADGFPLLFLVFQSLLCVTTIIVATVASYGRLPARIYIYLALFISLVLYPFLGRLLWHDLLDANQASWLAGMGFRDIAGATLIHSVAGWVALATLIMFGLRKKVGVGVNHKLGLRILSTLLISVGILTIIAVMASLHVSEFNNVFKESIVQKALSNALYAAFSAIVIAVVVSLIRFRRLHIRICTSAFIAGLVAISGSAFAVDMVAAVIIGAVAAMLMMVTASILEAINIDDALNIVPTHLVAGIWGSIAVGVFANTELLGSQLNLTEQLAIQVIGITFYGLVSFLPTCIFLWLLAKLNLLGIYSKASKEIAAQKASTLFSTLEEEARARKNSFRENAKATQALSVLTSYDMQGYDPKNPQKLKELTKKNLQTSFNTGVVLSDQPTKGSKAKQSNKSTSTGRSLRTTKVTKHDTQVTQANLASVAEQYTGYKKRYPSKDIQVFIEMLEDEVKATKPASYTTSLVLSKLSELRTSNFSGDAAKNEAGQITASDIFGIQIFCTAMADTLSHAESLDGQINAQFVNDIYFASALHRISTIGVDDELLQEIGKFDSQDYADLEEQSALPTSLIEDVSKKSKKKVKSQSLIQMCTDIAKAHQERWDGKGEPNGLKADAIPLAARIVNLVDSYIILRSRPAKLLSHPVASHYMLMNSMKQFDPVLVHHFFRINDLFEDNYAKNFSHITKGKYSPPTLERVASQALTNGQGKVIEPENTMELLMDL